MHALLRKGMALKRVTKKVSACWVLELPIDILFEILSRLTIETIFSSKCVCTMFLKIITDPYFSKLYTSKAPKINHSLIVQNNYLPSELSLAYISDLKNNDDYTNSRLLRTLAVPSIISQSKKHYIASLAGSCNGLLCLSYSTKDLTIFYICNPILGEFISLPQHRTNPNQIGAFGFCPETKKYKVIRFVTSIYCEIHTLGTDYWTRIKNAPYPNSSASFDSSLYGYLHWITTSSDISNMICSLDLKTEKFNYISPPPQFNRNTIKRISCVRVGAIEGLFCVFYLFDDFQLEVCVMKEYGVHASWTKKFIFNLNFLKQPKPIILMELLNNGSLLICYSYRSLAFYGLQEGTFRELKGAGYYNVVGHTPSFTSLKDLMGDGNVEVVRTN